MPLFLNNFILLSVHTNDIYALRQGAPRADRTAAEVKHLLTCMLHICLNRGDACGRAAKNADGQSACLGIRETHIRDGRTSGQARKQFVIARLQGAA